MKKFNKKFRIGGILFLAFLLTGAKIGENTLRLGDKTGSNIEFQMGNGRFKWDDTAQQLKFSNDAGGSEKAIGSGGGAGGGLNLLLDNNFDFESGDPPSAWTASGGTFTAETGLPLNGGQSGLWDPSVSAQNLDSPLKTVPITLEGNSCLARIFYKWETGSAGDIKLQALDSNSNVLSELDLVPTTGQVREAFVTFTCPTADTIRLRLTSTTNANVITVDDAHLGSNIKEIQVASAILAGEFWYQTDGNCVWSVTNTAATVFPTDSDCPAISSKNVDSSVVIDASDDDLPNWVFTSLAPGKYEITITGTLQGASLGAEVGVWLFDDTASDYIAKSNPLNVAIVAGGYPFTMQTTFTMPVAGPKTFIIHGSATSGAVLLHNGYLAATSGDHGLKMILKKFPLASDSALSFTKSKFFVSANIGGANFDLGTSTQASYIEMTNGGMDLVQNSVSDAVGIACIGTEEGELGQFTCTGNESNGIVFNADADVYRACIWFAHAQNGANGDTAFQIVETPNNAQTISQEGNTRLASVDRGGDSHQASPSSCGEFSFTSGGKKTLRLMYEQSLTAATLNEVLGDRASGVGQRDIHWTVERIHERRGGITFNNMVSTSISSGLKHNIARLNCDAASAILYNPGSWISVMGNVSAGECVITIAGGIYTVAPVCNALITSNAGVSRIVSIVGAPTTTNVTLDCHDDGGTACTSYDIELMCSGEE